MLFDIGTAKKITAGEMKGRIVTRDGCSARIVCWDAIGNLNILALIKRGIYETCRAYPNTGSVFGVRESIDDLFLEVPEDPKLSNAGINGKKEELLREAVHQHYQCDGKYPCEERAYCRFCEGENIAHDCDEDCCAEEFAEGFCSGWNACLKHLASIPWDEAMNEIVNYCKEKED